MERMRKIGLLVLISFLLALIICLPLFNKWLNVLLRVSETERKNNKGITFSIQHEDNPLNKELQDFAALYNALIENQKEGYKYYEIYGAASRGRLPSTTTGAARSSKSACPAPSP